MKFFLLISLFCLFPVYSKANNFSTHVNLTKIEIINGKYELNAKIKYNLSPTAKEALQIGIPLVWNVIIKVKQKEPFLDTVLKKIEINYRLHNHALLNLYSVKLNDQVTDMYTTLTAALNAISKIQNIYLIDKTFIQPDRHYYVAIKVMFNREALPIPLRPQSYFNSQWALSSQWTSWPLPN